MTTAQLKTTILNGGANELLKTLYGERDLEKARARCAAAIDSFVQLYGEREDAMILSVPGRSEITGNHTDHNHGRVIAASVDCDVIAVAARGKGRKVRVKSENYREDAADLDRLGEENYPRFKSVGLVAGMCRAFADHGLNVGPLDAYTTSNVLKGSGLSSSAAFEVMVGTILNHLWNEGAVSVVDVAKYAQWAENTYFGKPCGLMDQMACAVGGFVMIDFKDPADPVYEKIDFDLCGTGYELCIINTGGSHADLNDDYASIPAEMKAVAALFGKPVLQGLTEEELLSSAKRIRQRAGDRAFLRALHFVREDARVPAIAEAMKKGDVSAFLDGVRASGDSSFKYLQNVFSPSFPSEQGVAVALCAAERALDGCPQKSAVRVHGGGFAGTVQAFVPREYAEEFRKQIDRVIGEGSCMIMNVRPVGAVRIL